MTTDEQRIAAVNATQYGIKAIRYLAAAERCLHDPEATLEELTDGFVYMVFKRNGGRWVCELSELGNDPIRGSGGSIDMALADALTSAGEAMAAERDAQARKARG